MTDKGCKASICYVVTIPGTIEAFFIPQLRYLSENGFDVTCVCSNADSLSERFADSDVELIPVDIPRGISFAGMLSAYCDLRRLFAERHFDIVQYSTPNAALCAATASWRAGVRVRNYHLMGLRYLGEHGAMRAILKGLEKMTCSLSSHIECVSKSNLELGISEALFPREKATVVWNGSTGGVDLQRFDYSKRDEWRDDTRKRLGLASSDFVYGFVGRVTRDKGINELISAFRRIDDDSKMVLIGPKENTSTLDSSLMSWADTSDCVVTVDAVTDIEKYYPALDVLVLPSYREGFGNVVIEAAAMGVPAIVSDIPGPIDTVVPGKTALVVPAKNPDSLQNAMRVMRRSNLEAMSRNAREFVSDCFSGELLCEEILERKRSLAKTPRK